ncbi:MAG TPA: ABC transporter permease [Dinghuibacter sp.]|uniref:ABC transporter permease n=1 Tax=Dinghuibacter sp. TaxID=2024697 RepID=UPI002C21FA99|nr:ABC transporter permease [Dinghuibacter sp.]HTJ14185.1 ABC transporter permease [Dinghuibacter sp.]
MFRSYFVIAVRVLRRNPVYAFVNVLGLSLGLAAAILILLYVRDETSYDRFHRLAPSIYRVDREITRENGDKVRGGYSGYFQGPRFAASVPGVVSYTRFASGGVDLVRGTSIVSQAVGYVDTNFFSVFSFRMLSGGISSSPHSVVVSSSFALAQFGTVSAVGRLMSVRDGGRLVPYIVSGVCADPPLNSSLQFSVLMPLVTPSGLPNSEWFHFFLNTFVVVRPGASIPGLSRAMQQVYLSDARSSIAEIQAKYGIKDLGIRYFLQPLTDIHLSTTAGANEGLSDGSDPVYAYVLSGIALFILLIACINFVNLTVARSVKRAREIGVRKVIGGRRLQLAWQFMGESFLLCVLAFGLAVVIAQAVLPLFNTLSGKSLSFAYLLDTRLVLFYFLLLVCTSLLAGVYPALILSRYRPVETLYGRFLPSSGHFQRGLVVFQFVLATVLIVATAVIALQVNYMLRQPLGYDDRDVLLVYGAPSAAFERSLASLPFVQAVSLKNAGTPGNTVRVGASLNINISSESIDTGFFSLLHVPVVLGRNFSLVSDSSRSVIVNEAFVRQAGWRSPIGQKVSTFEPRVDYTVIGVVRDYHFRPLTSAIEPQFFTMQSAAYGMYYIKLAPGHTGAALSSIGRAFHTAFPLEPFSFDFMDDVNRSAYAAEERWRSMVLFGALLTVFISCIGLFGLSVLAAARRVKEIGIRKVLGASVGSLLALLSFGFLRLVGLALAIALPVAYYGASRWLQRYPYRVSLSFWMFFVVALLVVLVALLTVGGQAVRAARRAPVGALKGE